MPDSQATCLFTNLALPSNNTVEHTIPRALGGRIRSRIVSSSAFNKTCGSFFDPYLVRNYILLMKQFGPLMSSEHQPGNLFIDIEGAQGKMYLDEDGRVAMKGVCVLQRDDNDRPLVAAANNVNDLARWLEKKTANGKMRISVTHSPPTESTFTTDYLAISPILEIAALKSAMLSFDHLLSEFPERRFTRHNCLAPVRNFVRHAIETRTYSVKNLRQYSLGFQYEKLPKLDQIRERVGGNRQEFEHLLVASGNTSLRTLDCVFLIAGIDPFGFRLCDDWQGGDFLCAATNGMLIDGGIVGPVWESIPESICKPTIFRSCPGREIDGKVEIASEIVAYHYIQGLRRAVKHADLAQPEMIARSIENLARSNQSHDHTLGTAFKERLALRYIEMNSSSEDMISFDKIVEKYVQISEIGEAGNIPPVGAYETVNWPSVVTAYYKAMEELELRFGLPGIFFIDSQEIELDLKKSGRLDEDVLSRGQRKENRKK